MRWVRENETVITIAIALLALAISVKGCMNSEKAIEYSRKAYELSKEQSFEEKLLVLKAEIDNEQQYYQISPTNGYVILQQVNIFYPSIFNELSWKAKEPNFKIPTIQLNNSVLDEILSEVSEKIENEKDIIAMYKGNLPIAVKSVYIVKGSRFVDQSFYTLSYESILGLKNQVNPKLAFTGFSFVKRTDPSISPQIELDEQWNLIQERSRSFLKITK
jgi:hypothetical protein